MPWFVFAAIVVLGATGIHFFSKLANNILEPVQALVVTMAAGLFAALCFLPFSGQGWTKIGHIPVKSLLIYGAVGVCITIAHLGIFYMFRAGAPISLATPLVRFVPAVLAVILGYLVFQEQLRMVQILGIILAAISVVLVTRA